MALAAQRRGVKPLCEPVAVVRRFHSASQPKFAFPRSGILLLSFYMRKEILKKNASELFMQRANDVKIDY